MAKLKKEDFSVEDLKKPENANHYLDDLVLTAKLMKEQKEFKDGDRRSASESLSLDFLLILDHMLTKRNFSGYSRNWKDEFRSKSHELYVKHWHKFDPIRARLNYIQRDGELFLKDVEEFKGAFGWFSLFCRTGALDEIKRLKHQSAKLKEIVDGKNADLVGMESNHYTQ